MSISASVGSRGTGVLRPGAALPLLALLLAGFLGACSTHREIYPNLESLAANGQYAEAAEFVVSKKEDYGDRNAVLYNLDRGVFLHYAGKYEESNAAFELAELRMDELYTESISGNVVAFLSNDNTLPYGGEDFEQVTVNIYRALNYVRLGDIEAALVEARKVNDKLIYINDQYEEGDKNEYREDAFARLLTGMLYEAAGTRDDLNDAYISNRKAVGIYEKDFAPQYGTAVPEVLKANLLTTASFMGAEEFNGALAKFPSQQSLGLATKRKFGEIVFIHYAGRGPVKVETSITAIMPDGNIFRIAFPMYRRRSYLIHGSQIRVDGAVMTRLEQGMPLGAIAIKNLDNRKGRITAKAIARATTKYLASRALQRAAGDDVGRQLIAWVAGNVYTAATEQADLRSWQTLPDQILVGRVLLAPGKHRLQVEFTTGGAGVVSTQELGEIELQAGETRWFVLHSIN